jgi:hypothetical protein
METRPQLGNEQFCTDTYLLDKFLERSSTDLDLYILMEQNQW